jgi:hypothetical protein
MPELSLAVHCSVLLVLSSSIGQHVVKPNVLCQGFQLRVARVSGLLLTLFLRHLSSKSPGCFKYAYAVPARRAIATRVFAAALFCSCQSARVLDVCATFAWFLVYPNLSSLALNAIAPNLALEHAEEFEVPLALTRPVWHTSFSVPGKTVQQSLATRGCLESGSNYP